MKYIKLFENSTYDLMINTLNKYNELLKNLKPYVVFKYNELVKDPDYYPDWDSTPSIEYKEKDVTIIGAYELKNGGMGFDIADYDAEGVLDQTYFVWLDEGEVEEIKVKMESDKYNL